METASFNGLIKTLFIIFLIYYGLRFLMKLLAPVIVQEVVKKAEENFRQTHSNQYNAPSQQTRTEKPREKKKVGEYIDFEEIE
jgi:hypothetical protein